MDYTKRTLYADSKFHSQVDDTVELISKLPKLRINVIHKMQQW